MNDKASELLGQYELEVLRIRKGRGSLICETSDGSFCFKEYIGSEGHAKLQDKLLKNIAEQKEVCVEQIIPNREGELLVKDVDGVSYVLKTWQDGRECNIYNQAECEQAVRLLARLHNSMELVVDSSEITEVSPTEREFEKHNKEMKKVKKYLKQKGQKQSFETNLLHACDFFLNQAIEVTEEWKKYCFLFEKPATEEISGEKRVTFCHGDFQYHNVLLGQNGWFIINFEKCMPERPIKDLYLLLRKLLEKSKWSIDLGQNLIQAYQDVKPISARDFIDLYYRLAYPEKFWKIANFYYNSSKSWIPGKNQEKLDILIEQEKEKQEFLNQVFRNVVIRN